MDDLGHNQSEYKIVASLLYDIIIICMISSSILGLLICAGFFYLQLRAVQTLDGRTKSYANQECEFQGKCESNTDNDSDDDQNNYNNVDIEEEKNENIDSDQYIDNNQNENDILIIRRVNDDILPNVIDVFGTKRNKSFDIFRGLIMMIMALDHTRWTLKLSPSGTYWYPKEETLYTKFHHNLGLVIYYFICTFISLICAPGFFFLMGFGMIHFYEHRHSKLKWSNINTIIHLMIRGIIIILCGVIIWYPNEVNAVKHGVYFGDDVLVPLGVNMFLISIFIFIENYMYNHNNIFYNYLGIIIIFLVLLFCVISTEFLVPNYDEYCTDSMVEQDLCTRQCYNKFLMFFWISGKCDWIKTDFAAIPYMTYVCIGIIIARYTIHCKKYNLMDICMRNCVFLAMLMFVCFIIIRWFDRFGNFGVPWRHNVKSPWYIINFLNTTKYPPSIASILLFMSINIFIIYFSYIYYNKFGDNRVTKIILVFGNTALFFYILHITICYSVIDNIASLIDYDVTSWIVAVLLPPLWICVLLICYPFCRWYMKFKKSKHETSIWRMF